MARIAPSLSRRRQPDVPSRPSSLAAEDRSAGVVRDQTETNPWSALGPHDTGNPGLWAGMSGHDG